MVVVALDVALSTSPAVACLSETNAVCARTNSASSRLSSRLVGAVKVIVLGMGMGRISFVRCLDEVRALGVGGWSVVLGLGLWVHGLIGVWSKGLWVFALVVEIEVGE